MLKYFYHKTEKINDLLVELRALKIVFETITPLPHIEENARRESLLKSSLFSARIEGNPLTLSKVSDFNSIPRSLHKLEVSNLMSTYKFVNFGEIPKYLTERFIFRLHQMVLKKISAETGHYRQERWAIFNQAGVAVYLAPSHTDVPLMVRKMIKIAGDAKELAPAKAAFIQFIFEKIHPFADGNGRVGRLISSYILKAGNYHFRGLVSLEEFVDENRSWYYRALEPDKDATDFIEFFLESLVVQAKRVLEKLKERKEELPEDSLLPRRREILEIIKDHPQCSFDFLARRFQSVNPKTLHYDVRQLQEKGFVQKVGSTRGSLYRVR